MGEVIDRFDEHLPELARFVEDADSLEKGLERLASLVGHAMSCDRCSIMLVKPDPDSGEPRLRVQAHHGNLADRAYEEHQPLGHGISGQVSASGKEMLIRDLHRTAYADAARREPEDRPVDIIVVPIRLEGEVIGVINLDSPADGRRLSTEDLRIASILALVVSRSILIHRLKGLLRTSFTQMALARQPDALNGPITHEPRRVARLLAQTMYDEMQRAGFSDDHVLTAATELISHVSEARK